VGRKEDFFFKKKKRKGSYVVLQEKWISAAEECKGSFIKEDAANCSCGRGQGVHFGAC
jgi:hypothetical protein